ncbi:NAD(P)H-dependent oxidoreductase [Streptococcus equinus]|uniref:NAD(P)H-dependent oxidoreductase n=1 Tax=Streptococcus equinus TaxID=1335 RepID=UPI0005F86993|nr:NAD(P)H-dependent oxidoreductase [Streptococcus equinus]
MKTVIVYAHPYENSFNHAILEQVKNQLTSRNIDFDLIDLYNDNFNPAYTVKELAVFKEGKTTDDLVKKYQKILKNAEEIIFIFPIWWNDVPAIIKGFIDKNMKKKFAYNVGKTGVIGNLTNIKKATILTTSTSPTWYLRVFCGDAIKSVFINATLKQLGFKNIKWKNMGNIDKSTMKQREKYLKNLES